MIEIVLTCLLSGSFVPPTDWTLLEIISPPASAYVRSSSRTVACFAVENGCELAEAQGLRSLQPSVRLKRTFKAGEKITLPLDRCSMETK